jgi:beta-glucosidase-like glycosyl hydrolase
MQVMVPYRYELFLKDLISLVKEEKIPIERIDDAVERILRVKFVAGLFELNSSDRPSLDTIGCKVTFAIFSTWCIGILACFNALSLRKAKAFPFSMKLNSHLSLDLTPLLPFHL